MSLLTDLSAVVGDAFEAIGLDRSYGDVVVSQRPELSQFQCNGALAAAKGAGRNPREIAEEVVARVSTHPMVTKADIAGPGFVNIDVADAELRSRLDRLAGDDRLGVPVVESPRRVIVDYGGANVAKDLHVGHVRVALIGESIKRMFGFVGHDVVGDVHLGDWGAPMGQLIAEMEDRFPHLPYFDPHHQGPYPVESPVTIEDLQEMYPVASAKAKEDPEFGARTRLATVELQNGRPGYRALWEQFRDVSIEALRDVYDSLDVHFDLWLGEASVHDRIAPMVERMKSAGVAVESDGAVVVHVQRDDDKREVPPLMLVNSRGGFTYATSDLATIEERVGDMGAEEIVYVVDLRQSLHFEQVFRAAYLAGIAGPDVILDHSGNGTVNGPDGRPFKTRQGGLPRLRETVAEAIERARARLDESEIAVGYSETERAEIARRVGLAALKFGDLSNHRASDYAFDLERFTQLQGKTGPYIQYVTARAGSLLAKATEREWSPGPAVDPQHAAERQLILELTRLPEVIDRALAARAPNHLAEYAFDLAGRFNRFYDACHVLTEADPNRRASWLTLVDTTRRQLVLVLGLLGIEVPERM
jgi:arginyl-tRNA synthetase